MNSLHANFAMRSFFLLIVFIFLSWQNANSINADTIGIYRELTNKSGVKQIAALIKLARYIGDIKIDNKTADSVANEAVLQSKILNNYDLIASSILTYSEFCTAENIAKAEKYVQSIVGTDKISNNQKCNLFLQACNMHLNFDMNSKAENDLQNAFNFIFENKENRIKYLIVQSELFLKKNEKLASFKNLNEAIVLSKTINNDSLVFVVYKKLSIFYYLINEWEKAKDCIGKCKRIIAENPSFTKYDSLLLQADLMLIYTGNSENELATIILDELYPICIKNKYDYLKEYLFRILRKSYLSSNRQKEICDIYCVKYPIELENLKNNDLKNYYKVNALIQEKNGMIDSAKYYWRLSEFILSPFDNAASVANFYKRKAEFFLRQQNSDSALHFFQFYLNFAIQSNYFPFVIDAAHQLDSMFASKGNYVEAYRFANLSKLYSDSNASLLEKDKVVGVEIENLTKLNELQAEKEALQENKKTNFQLSVIIFIIIVCFILLVIISRWRISRTILKTFSYLTFVLFFEFIVYLLDGMIHHWTHGAPLYIMAIKVVLIGMMLPIHHATDYRVTEYLLKKKLITEKKRVGFRGTIQAIWKKTMNWIQIHSEHEALPNENK